MMIRTKSSTGRTLVVAIAVAAFASWLLPAVAANGQTTGPGANPERARDRQAPADDAGKPAASPSPAARKSKTSRADCERYARALAGRDKNAALLKQTDVKAMAVTSADLVTCSAVLVDSDEPCARLGQGDADTCKRDRAIFHELREYPNGHSATFNESKYQECKQNAAMAPVCDALRNALRSGDPSHCVLKADFDAICRSAGDLDVSKCATEAPELKKLLEAQCRALATLDESACDVPGPRHEEMAKQCRDDIKANKAYGKSLKELAKSGAPREKELAKAALNDSDACKALTESAIDACERGEAAPATDDRPGTAAPEPADGAPSPHDSDAPAQ